MGNVTDGPGTVELGMAVWIDDDREQRPLAERVDQYSPRDPPRTDVHFGHS